MKPYFIALSSQIELVEENLGMKLLNTTEAVVLAVLAKGPRYGLELMRVVEEVTGGRLVITLGGLYPTLNRIEKKGLLKSRWDTDEARPPGARRRYYWITSVGRKELRVLVEILRTPHL